MGLFDLPFFRRRHHHPGWPVTIGPVVSYAGDKIRLRPLSIDDGLWWRATRLNEQHRLEPVEPTAPDGWENHHNEGAWNAYSLSVISAANQGLSLPFVIEVNGQPAGELCISGIVRGTECQGSIGYWVAEAHTGKHVATIAVALATDHAFTHADLHRITATYQDENPASGKVLTRNGYRHEGYAIANIHINGRWQDHHLMALTREEFSSTAISRLIDQGLVAPSDRWLP